MGFDLGLFAYATRQFVMLANVWICAIPLLVLLAVKRLRLPWGRTSPLMVLASLIVLPQILLYMSSGFYAVGDNDIHLARFLVPALVGYSYWVIHLVRQVRLMEERRQDTDNAGRYWGARRLMTVAHLICLLTLWTGLTLKIKTSYAEGKAFAAYSARITDWFEVIRQHTTRFDTILFVSNASRLWVRIHFMIDRTIGPRTNYAYIIPEEQQALSDRPRVKIVTSSIKQIVESTRAFPELVDDVDMVILLGPDRLWLEFLEGEKSWLNTTTFRRYDDPAAGTIFYRE